MNFDPAGNFDNQTLHVVCITDPLNGYMAIYTNGVLRAAQNVAQPPLSGVSAAWSFIGRSLWSADAWFNGTIDELRIYDGRLTEEEITANYEHGPNVLALPVRLNQSHSPGEITLSWPSWAAGFNAEATVAPESGLWSPLTLPSTLADDLWSVTTSQTNSMNFFRLKR